MLPSSRWRATATSRRSSNLRDAFAQVMESPEHKDVILDDLDLQGLIAITPASMSLRARIKTLAGKQSGGGPQ